MAFDYCKLRGRIVEKFGSQGLFASALGISENTLSLKLNNKLRFTSDDIMVSIELLDIPHKQISEYFFKEEVHKN